MRRPLVSMAISLALGILIGSWVGVPPHVWLVVAAVLAAVGLVLLFMRVAPHVCFGFVLAVVLCAGAAHGLLHTSEYASATLSSLIAHDSRIIRLRGVIANMPEERGSARLLGFRGTDARGRSAATYSIFTLRVSAIRDGGKWGRVQGRLRVSGPGSARHLTVGDSVEFAARVQRVPPPTNPGEFDFAAYLKRNGISGQATVGYMEAVRASSGAGGVSRLSVFRWVHSIKRRIVEVVERDVPVRSAAILKCLVLGDRHALTEDQDRIFRETGTVHFLAISGLHVGLLAAFCWCVLVACGARHQVAASVVLVVVLLYAMLAGFRPSVQRASVMCAVICGAFIFRRKPSLGNSLSLALMVVLIHDPAQLQSAGLQLSFVAVLGIWLFAGPIERRLFGFPDKLDHLQAPEERAWLQHPVRWFVQKAVSVAIAAWVVTLPLRLFHFGMMTPLAPLGSVVLLPAVWLVLVAGLPGTLLLPLIGGYAQPLLVTASFGARAMEAIAGWLARIPGVVFHVPPPGWGWVVLCYVILAAIACRAALRLNARRIVILALIPAFAYLGFVWYRPAPREPRVAVLSVGSGNCVLVRFPSGKNILFDAGSSRWPKVGERIVVPALWSLGVRRLDLVILSHGDADHYSGFADVAQRIPIGRLAVSPRFERNVGTEAVLREAAARHIEVLRIGSGDRITGFPGAEMDVLWPPREFEAIRKFSSNELSAVVRIQTRDAGRILLTGDFGQRAAGFLLGEEPDLAADILQVPHHGLRDAAASRLTEAIAPQVAIIPGGLRAENPSPYGAHGGKLFSTDSHGMVTVDLLPDLPPRVTTFLEKRPE